MSDFIQTYPIELQQSVDALKNLSVLMRHGFHLGFECGILKLVSGLLAAGLKIFFVAESVLNI